MATKKSFSLRLNESDAEVLDEICTQRQIGSQRALEEAAKEYLQRELRYLKGKEECRSALLDYLDNGEVINESEMEMFVQEKLRSKGIEV